MKPPKRPVGALVIAILNFVFGGFSLLGIVLGGLIILLLVILLGNMPPPPPAKPNAPAPPDISAALHELGDGMMAIPGVVPYAVINAIEGVLAPIVLLISGYGLLKMRRYGRTLAIIYAVVTLVFLVCNTAYTLAYFNEGMMNAYQRYMDALMPKGAQGGPAPPAFNMKQMQSPGAIISQTIMGIVMGAAYPIAILAVMYRREVRDAFSGTAPVVLPSERKRPERLESREEEEIQDALPGRRPAPEDGIKEATNPGISPPREDA